MKIPKKIVGLDFETYYSVYYSLRKKDTSTTEYVRDARFKAQCVGIQHEHETKAKYYYGEDIKRSILSIDWANSAVLCHHTHFDGLILNHHFGVTPSYYLCTLSMARPLHGGQIGNGLDELSRFYGGKGKVSDVLERTKGIRDLDPELMDELCMYCAQDVQEMWRIFRCMRPKYPQSELDLIHHTIRAYADPILRVNKALAKRVHVKEVARKRDLLEKLEITDRTQLTGREKFANRLRALGVEPEKKISPSTGKPTYAFAKKDIAFQKLETHPNADVRELVEGRLICQSSQEETRARRLLSHSSPALPLYLAYGKAHTFRWAGGDKMNPQNFGRESLLRNAITAPPGYKLVVIDSAQIEARVNAWLAGETELVEAFRRGDDIYSVFAGEEIYFIAVDQVTKAQRFVGKTTILGLGYQMGAEKFKYTLESGAMGPPVFLEEHMYAETVRRYRARFAAIRKQWYFMNDMLSIMYSDDRTYEYGPLTFHPGGVLLPSGLSLHYPNLHCSWDERREENYDWRYNENSKIYGGLLTENVVQALARIVVSDQALELGEKYRIVLLVHDEVVLCVPNNQVDNAMADAIDAFHKSPSWCSDLPVAGEGCISKHYLKM